MIKSLLLVVWLFLALTVAAAGSHSIRDSSRDTRRRLEQPVGTAPTSAPTKDDSWPVGTMVAWEFDDGWYEGTITDYDADGYTITWSDDSIDYDDFSDDDVDQMVENYDTMFANGTSMAASASDGGMKPGAKFVIAAVVLLSVFAGIFYFRRARKNRKEEMQELNIANLDRTKDFT